MNNYQEKLKYYKNLTILFLFLSQTSVLCLAASGEPPSLSNLSAILSRIVGLFLAASAAALVIMIAYGIIKGSLAAGDPRGLEGAKSTWTYAIYGFLVVILSMFIVTIIRGRLGLTGPVGFGIFFEKIMEAITSLITIGQGNSDPTNTAQ